MAVASCRGLRSKFVSYCFLPSPVVIAADLRCPPPVLPDADAMRALGQHHSEPTGMSQVQLI